MEKLMIFDMKSRTIYQGYWDRTSTSAFVAPDWGIWNPFEAFNLSLEDVASKNDDYNFQCSLGCIENASYTFQQVLDGIRNYNNKNPDKPFNASLIITTLDELKKKYKDECSKESYLSEKDPDRAAKVYAKNNKYSSTFESFTAGVKWAWKQEIDETDHIHITNTDITYYCHYEEYSNGHGHVPYYNSSSEGIVEFEGTAKECRKWCMEHLDD